MNAAPRGPLAADNDSSVPRVRTPKALWGLLVTMAVVTAAAVWLDMRASREALEDFAQLQVTLADGIRAGLGDDIGNPQLLAGLETLERTGERVVFVKPAGGDLVRPSGQRVDDQLIEQACAERQRSLKLSHEQSVAIGLAPRTSWAGLAFTHDGGAIIAVSSGYRASDRGTHAHERLWFTVATDCGLMLVCGVVLARHQRQTLELDHARRLSEATASLDDKLARSSRAGLLGTLAMGVAHEISTPLGIISQRAEQLRGSDDSEAQRLASAIAQQTSRIDGSIRSFLGLVRGHASALTTIDVATIVASARELVDHTFVNAGVALSVPIAVDTPLLVRGDTRLLETALVNLLINARHAATPGSNVDVSLSAADDTVAISVRDHGAGIPQAVASRLAEPFLTTKAPGEGTGLGLAIVKEIVRHHRGDLTVAAAETGGTIATIRLPRAGEIA